MSGIGLPELDVYRPWVWPRSWQAGAWTLLFGVGAVSCVWLELGPTWFAQERAAQLEHAQALQTLADLQSHIAEKTLQVANHKRTTAHNDALAELMPRLRTAAQDAGLTVVSEPLNSVGDQTSELTWVIKGQTRPVWQWLHQMGQMPASLVLQKLNVQAGAAHIAQVQATWQWTPVKHASLLDSEKHVSKSAEEGVGFDASHWGRVQRLEAAQHPSYVQWVRPELQRSREWLEQFPLSEMRYQGSIAKSSASRDPQQALVRLLDASMAMQPVVRVSVGSYIGPNFGRVQEIASDHLLLRELWRNDQGVWSPRWLKWPLGGGDPMLISDREAP